MTAARRSSELASRLVANHRRFRAFVERRAGNAADTEDSSVCVIVNALRLNRAGL